jgi:S-adenosylmethionine-diacylgycerolhomoserine-N-methlytransferase
MSILTDLKTLYHLTLTPIRGKSHAERLDSFYRNQAGDYDGFRKRLLQGREELMQSLPFPEGGTWIDMGGGTGQNVEFVGDRLKTLRKVYIVDLASSLLEVAQKRVRERGWTNVEPVTADATTFAPAEGQVDVVTFSYSLTMIPDWFAALDRAYELLKPGGHLGVVDFYVSRKHPDEGRLRHRWFTRSFWPVWFANDNVYPSADHVPYLHRKFEPVHFSEHRARVPFLIGLKVPYYRFVGKKREAPGAPR